MRKNEGKTSRRDVLSLGLRGGLFGAGLVGLRSLATGLPLPFLLRPTEATADEACADAARAQYLVLSTSDAGDPVNGNVPGTYELPDIAHPQDPLMAPTML